MSTPGDATVTTPSRAVGVGRRWAMLGVGTGAQAAAAAIAAAPGFLIPELHRPVDDGGYGLTLAEAGLVAAAPSVGLLLTLVLWGMVVDRRGERFALLTGLGLATACGVAATTADGPVAIALALLLAGVGAAATNSASGRVVVGWFPVDQRGLAMGIRQTGQPLGVGLAAATVAPVAHAHGVGTALWAPTAAVALAAVAVAVVVLDPPRPPRAEAAHTANPYRADRFLARVHTASMLLVVPQIVVWTFGLAWLVEDLDYSPGLAGAVIAGTQVVGAAARVGAGWVSDRLASRMRPMRDVAVVAAVTMLALGAAAGGAEPHSVLAGVAVLLLVLASGVTVADNGLAFTAVAERAGPFWSGRALGLQNTAQYVAVSAVPPLAGLVITAWGYGAAFAVAAALPLLAVALVPVRHERAVA